MAKEQSTAAVKAPAAQTNGNPGLPASVARRGINEETWRTLCNSVFPGALGDSILMAVDYCRARGLDVLKKPCHIVPMNVSEKRRRDDGTIEEKQVWRDVILPGIYEYRITARRTGEYLGRSEFKYGPMADFRGLKAPEFCSVIIYRWHKETGRVVEFPVECDFSEVCTTKNDGKPNSRWTRAPKQMLKKCTEAAALREAFPDELGGEPTAEEMEGRTIEYTTVGTDEQTRAQKPAVAAPQPKQGALPAPANDEQLKQIRAAIDKTGIPESTVLAQYEVGDFTQLNFDQAQHALEYISANAP